MPNKKPPKMGLPDFPELDLEQEDDEIEMYKYYYDETQEWKLEYEEILRSILQPWIKYRETANILNRPDVETLLNEIVEKVLGSDGCKICGKPVKNGNSFCLKHIVENLEG